MRVAALEIGASRAAYEQHIAGENCERPGRIQHEAERFIRVSGRVDALQRDVADAQGFPPSTRRRDTQSALVCSPITVTHPVASRKSPSAVM